MKIQALQQALGISLSPLPDETDLENLMRHEYKNHYLLNDAGEIIGLNLCEGDWTDEKTRSVWECRQLQFLNLSENQLSKVVIPQNMTKLRMLDVSDNESLTSFSFGDVLPQLERLDMSDSKIGRLMLEAGFESLKYLDASRNEIVSFQYEGALSCLVHLDLSGNQLEHFQIKNGFQKLLRLYLNQNQIQELSIYKSLPKLEVLHLSNNQLRNFPILWLDLLPKLESLYLYENPLPDSIRGFVDQDDFYSASNALSAMQFRKQELAKGETVNNEYKVLLVGNGKVGKSCLVERLIKDEFIEEWDSTHGISVVRFEDKEKFPFILNLWDFGGQDIYHATHRLFMQSNAIYLALWDWETYQNPFTEKKENNELRRYENHSLDYWLNYVQHLGGNSPVIVIKTKFKEDGIKDHPDQADLRAKYPKAEFHAIDSKEDDWWDNGFKDLLHLLEKSIYRLNRREEIPLPWSKLRDKIRSIQEKEKEKKRMPLEEYEELAESLNVGSPFLVLENWLVKTGVVFFREGLFNNEIILDQQWAINAVYTLFDRNLHYYELLIAKKGQFNGAYLSNRIWKKKSREEQELLMSFMLSCQICFELEEKDEENRYRYLPFEERQYIIPQLLPEEVPVSVISIDRSWKNNPSLNVLYMQYRHHFLHYGKIQEFIVKTQTYAEVEDIWRYGIKLVENGVNAIVKTEAKSKIIDVIVPDQGKKLFQKIRHLLEDLEDGPVEEWVSLDGKEYVNLERLKKEKDREQIVSEQGSILETEDFRIFLQTDEKHVFESSEPGRKLSQVVENIPQELPKLEAKPHQIAFFAAVTAGQKSISWKDEYADIHANLSNDFSLCSRRGHTNKDDLVNVIEDEEPHIIHFCGHGQEKEIDNEENITQEPGLIFFDETKRGEAVLNAEETGKLFGDLKEIFPQISMVVLSACHSDAHAQAISAYDIYTIGTSNAIHSDIARRFSGGFYRTLSKTYDLRKAFKMGIVKARSDRKGRNIENLIKLFYRGKQIY